MYLRTLCVVSTLAISLMPIHAQAITPAKEITAEQGLYSEDDQLEPTGVERATASEPLSVERRAGLAAHLGLTPKDVVFGKPRNFRSEKMNDFQLEPLNDTETEPN